MSPPFRVSLFAMALMAALGSLPVAAQHGGGGEFEAGVSRVASIVGLSALVSIGASSARGSASTAASLARGLVSIAASSIPVSASSGPASS